MPSDAAFPPDRPTTAMRTPMHASTTATATTTTTTTATATATAAATATATATATTLSLPIAADHPAFAGHFPGQPLLPGVSLVAEALEAVLQRPELVARFDGRAPSIAQVKFLAPVRPGDLLALRLTPSAGGRLAFDIHRGEQQVASGQFAVAAGTASP